MTSTSSPPTTPSYSAPSTPLKHLLADGKSLYQTAHKVKLQDYTLRKVLQQVSREQGDDSATKGPKAA